MPSSDLTVNSVISATGWTAATVANLSSSNTVSATDGEADELISTDIDDAPGDFVVLTTVQLFVEARIVGGTPDREKQITFTLRDSGDTILETLNTGNITSSYVVYSSSAIARSDVESVIDGYRLRALITEGGGMPDSITVEIDHMFLRIVYADVLPPFFPYYTGSDEHLKLI